MSNKINSVKTYDDMTHTYGRIWLVGALIFMLAFPVTICIVFKVTPSWEVLFSPGVLSLFATYWIVGIIEFFTYVPMLGSAGSYLSFVTGNLGNLKIPCALNAMNLIGVKADTEEGELTSTISIAVSSLVTTLIIIIGVVLAIVINLDKILTTPALQPAFDMCVPALFGGLGVYFISKDWKVAMAPLIVSLVFFIAFPTLGAKVGTGFIPIAAVVSIVAARIMYKKGLLDKKEKEFAPVQSNIDVSDDKDEKNEK